MLAEGKQTFRFDTFGDEAFWGDTLKLHEAVAKLSPKAGAATLAKGVWTVQRSLPKGSVGGVALAISKADGRILRISHGK
jgi:hypothetical protein